MKAEKCGYKGPEPETLPNKIAGIVENVRKVLPAEATLELCTGTVSAEALAKIKKRNGHCSSDVHFVSDDRGLVQTIYYEGNQYFNMRVTGILPRGTREDAIGYHKKPRVTVSTPAETKAEEGHAWLVESHQG